jgi:hypothetical protein
MDARQRQPRLSTLQKVSAQQRATLLARLQTVQLLQMSEREISELVKQVEADPLFQKLLYAPTPSWKVLRFQPHPRTRLAGSFYEMNEETLPAGARPEAGVVLAEGREALALIRKIGQESFEKYFLRAETELDRAALAQSLSVAEPDIQKIRDFMLSYSIQAEFFDAPTKPSTAQRVVRLARLALNAAGEPEFEFRSPLLARGRYDIQYERLQSLLKGLLDDVPRSDGICGPLYVAWNSSIGGKTPFIEFWTSSVTPSAGSWRPGRRSTKRRSPSVPWRAIWRWRRPPSTGPSKGAAWSCPGGRKCFWRIFLHPQEFVRGRSGNPGRGGQGFRATHRRGAPGPFEGTAGVAHPAADGQQLPASAGKIRQTLKPRSSCCDFRSNLI